MSDWWSVIKETPKYPPTVLFGRANPTPKEPSPEMEEDIEAVVEQEQAEFEEKKKPKQGTKFLGGGLIRDGETVKRYKGRD
jgi:hypothetical protein|tara:strand:- start:700 stop:942 length:243 start_codon:yes stop_codon:yes gene_type:complete